MAEPREAMNLNEDGTHRPTRNEVESAIRGAIASLHADGASEEQIQDALKEVGTGAPVSTHVVEVLTAAGGSATRYTLPEPVVAPVINAQGIDVPEPAVPPNAPVKAKPKTTTARKSTKATAKK